jgi:hypothetical protein
VTDIKHVEARHKRQEALARLIAADKMLLVSDPLGLKLPDDLWQRYLGHAAGVLTLIWPGETPTSGDSGIMQTAPRSTYGRRRHGISPPIPTEKASQQTGCAGSEQTPD